MYDDCYEMAYLAGAFDGDGSFSLIKKVEDLNRSPLYYPFIQFGSNGLELPELLKKKFNGNIVTRKPHKAKEGFQRKEFFTFRVEKAPKCKPFLEKIIPYLRIKKERANALLDYINENPFKRGSRKLDKEVIARRERAYIKIRCMNDARNVNESLARQVFNKSAHQDELFWPYVAGLMDTDGSFSINAHRYVPTISLSMVDIKGISYIKSQFGEGCVNVITAKTCQTGVCYRWYTKKLSTCIAFLVNIIPYLRTKKENAETLLQFCREKKPTLHRRSGVSIEETQKREFYHQKLCCLNKYGIYKPSLIDLEAQKQGDRGQAGINAVQPERLSEMASVS